VTPSEINRAIAESVGWKPTTDSGWCVDPDGQPIITPPNYHGDLNACAEFEKTITGDSRECYAENIAVAVWGSAIGNTMSYMGASQLITATARSRCEAYLRTRGKWRTE